MEETSEIVEEKKSKCVLCNKETALAGFGIVLGIVFIMMSLDTIRRMRIKPVEVGTDA